MINLQKLLKYFNRSAVAAGFRIPLAWFRGDWATLFPNNVALYSKDLKLLVLVIFALKLVPSSFE